MFVLFKRDVHRYLLRITTRGRRVGSAKLLLVQRFPTKSPVVDMDTNVPK